MSKIISSYIITELIAKACELNPSAVYRVVIDAVANEPVSIKVYQWGTDQLAMRLQEIDTQSIKDSATVITDDNNA